MWSIHFRQSYESFLPYNTLRTTVNDGVIRCKKFSLFNGKFTDKMSCFSKSNEKTDTETGKGAFEALLFPVKEGIV